MSFNAFRVKMIYPTFVIFLELHGFDIFRDLILKGLSVMSLIMSRL